MSWVSKYFHAGNIKIIVALAIPAGMVWLFITAKQQADTQMAEISKTMPKGKQSMNITTENYSLREVDDKNAIHWELKAKRGTMNPGTKDIALEEVNVHYFDKDGTTLKMELNAPAGIANELSMKVELDGLNGKPVIAESDGGKAKLIAKRVELKQKNQFIATGGVNIEWPKVA